HHGTVPAYTTVACRFALASPGGRVQSPPRGHVSAKRQVGPNGSGRLVRRGGAASVTGRRPKRSPRGPPPRRLGRAPALPPVPRRADSGRRTTSPPAARTGRYGRTGPGRARSSTGSSRAP